MTRRLSIGIVMAAAALTLGTAADARAQQRDTTTSESRIRVQKDRRTYGTASGAVAVDSAAVLDSMRMVAERDSIARAEQMRQDSIARVEQARLDSIAAAERARQDSIMRVEQARLDSIARADSIRMAQEAAWMNARGFYVGIGAGSVHPSGDFGDFYEAGWNVTGVLGWQRPLSPLGLRLDLSYSQFGGDTFDDGGGPVELDDATVLSAMLDAKWQLPFGSVDMSRPVRQRTGLYLVGGGGIHRFDEIGGFEGTGEDGEASTDFGLNGGAGFQFGWGGLSTLFVEARYVTVFNGDDEADIDNSSYIPVVVGITF